MKPRKIVFTLILGLIIVSSGCFDLFMPSAPKHDTLVITLDDEPRSLLSWENFNSGDLAAFKVFQQLYSFLGMLAPGETTYTMPGIAESWTVNTDRTEWTFTLRNGLTFHDASKITTEDVEYSLRAAFTYGDWSSPNMENTSDPAFNDYFNVTYSSPEALTFTISSTTRFPDPMFEWDFSGMWDLYAIVPKNCFETEEQQEAYRKRPISAGPYMLASENDSITGESITFSRFDDWYGWGQTFTASNGQQYTFPTAKKAFKYVKYVFIDEVESKLIHLNTYDVDAITIGGTGGRSSRLALDELRDNSDFSVQEIRSVGGTIIQTNIQGNWPTVYGGPRNFPVSQLWFRKAIAHAINQTNLVENTFNGIAEVRNTIYSDWMIEKYPNLNTSGYYTFDFDINKSKQILDDAGYLPLGFADEPENRFGFGIYANETTIDGEEQTRGRQFVLLTPETQLTIMRAIEIQKDLRQIGIYVDIDIPVFEGMQNSILGTAGMFYNTTGPQPYPEFHGGDWDLILLGYGGFYDTPNEMLLAYMSFAYWYYPATYGDGPGGWGWYGRMNRGWFNEDYEITYAKIHGEEPGYSVLWDFMDPPEDMPVGGYPVPEWSNDDSQYIEGCSVAGKILSNDLPVIPVNWYHSLAIFRAQIKNLVFNQHMYFHAAYAYWET